MSTRIVKGAIVGRRHGDDGEKALGSPTGWFVMAPVGSEIIDVAFNGAGQIVAEVDCPARGVDVELPLILTAPGQEYTPLIGATRGAYLGKAMLRQDRGLLIIYVFKQEPWPSSTLEAVRAGGTA